MSQHREFLDRYYAAVAGGATGQDLAAFYANDAQQIEYPNRVTPDVKTRDLDDLQEAAARGQKAILSQDYEIVNLIEAGNTAVVELIWRGRFSIPLGSLAVGDTMVAYIAQVFEFEEGKIKRQRNYDCFVPF